MSADKALSWSFAEDFIAEDDALCAARAQAQELGADPVSAATGALLRLLAGACGAKAVLEIGTGVGVSGLWLLSAMSADAVLTTIDSEAEFHRLARRAFSEAGYPPQRTRLITGRALDVLPRMAPRAYDLVVLDAQVSELGLYLEQAERIIRPGGIVAIMHALWHDQVSDPARRDGNTVAMRQAIQSLRSNEEFLPTLLTCGDGVIAAIRR